MKEVVSSSAVFFSYALLAIFAQNAVFTRALGVSRMVQLVGDDRTSSALFGMMLCITQVLVAPVAFLAGRFIAPLDNRAQLRPEFCRNGKRVGIHEFAVGAFHLQIGVRSTGFVILEEVQKHRKHRLHVGNRIKRVSTLPTKTGCFDFGRLDFVFRQACAFRKHAARLVAVQAAPGQILHAD